MSTYPWRQLNPVILTTGYTTTSAGLVFTTSEFMSKLVTPKFILQVDQTLPYGDTDITLLTDTTTTTPTNIDIFDRLGYYVRADRFYRAICMRRTGQLLFCTPSTNDFQCVIRHDPLRIVCLDCLPPSIYVNNVVVNPVMAVLSTTPTPPCTGDDCGDDDHDNGNDN
jgi:hypothetical protein